MAGPQGPPVWAGHHRDIDAIGNWEGEMARLTLARLGAVLCAAGMLAACASDMGSEKAATMTCVYRSLKSDPDVRSVAAYSIDGMRHAIEYTFRGKDGRDLVADVMISGRLDRDFGWSVVAFHGETSAEGFEELEFLMKAVPDLDAKCHMTPIGDHLLPEPKSRSEWQPVDLGG
ncbi:MAG TPA: hypothetical protein VG889_16595 [Rhizomicrobium sp.]|nr:hypothetical protein [Rhizomicrobium sp.]